MTTPEDTAPAAAPDPYASELTPQSAPDVEIPNEGTPIDDVDPDEQGAEGH